MSDFVGSSDDQPSAEDACAIEESPDSVVSACSSREDHADRIAGLPHRQSIAARALLAGKTHAEAGKEAGLTRQHVSYLSSSDSTFRAVLTYEKQKLFEEMRNRLAYGAGEALNTVIGLMNDPDAPAATKLRAASMMLQIGAKYEVYTQRPFLHPGEQQTVHHLDEQSALAVDADREAARAEAARLFDESGAGTRLVRLRDEQAYQEARMDELSNERQALEDRLENADDDPDVALSAEERETLELQIKQRNEEYDQLDASTDELAVQIERLERARSLIQDQAAMPGHLLDTHCFDGFGQIVRERVTGFAAEFVDRSSRRNHRLR